MTQKRKHGSKKAKNPPKNWVKRTPKRKRVNSPSGLTKLMKTWGRMFIMLFFRGRK